MTWKVVENEFGRELLEIIAYVLESPGIYLWFKLINVQVSVSNTGELAVVSQQMDTRLLKLKKTSELPPSLLCK